MKNIQIFPFSLHNLTWFCIKNLILVLCLTGCQGPGDQDKIKGQRSSETDVLAVYRGNQYDGEYDSIVNVLTMKNNESFTLWQLDRIAEHHLNEREHEGIYALLGDSTQMGLFDIDGTLMLRFGVEDGFLLPISMDGDSVLDSSNRWKLMEGRGLGE